MRTTLIHNYYEKSLKWTKLLNIFTKHCKIFDFIDTKKSIKVY